MGKNFRGEYLGKVEDNKLIIGTDIFKLDRNVSNILVLLNLYKFVKN